MTARKIDDPETIALAVHRRADWPDLDGEALLQLALDELAARDRSIITERELEAQLVAEARIAHTLTGLTITNTIREPGISGNYVELAITFGGKLDVTNMTARLVTPDEQATLVTAEAEALLRAASESDE